MSWKEWDVDIEQLRSLVQSGLGGPWGVSYSTEPTEQEVVFYPEQLLGKGYTKLGTIIPGNGLVYYIWERSGSVHGNNALAGLCVYEEGHKLKYLKTEYEFANCACGDSAWKLCRKYCVLLKRGILYREREKTFRSRREGGTREEEMERMQISCDRRKVGRHRRRIICEICEELGMDPQEMFGPKELRGFGISETEEPMAVWSDGDGEELHSPSLRRTNASRDLSQDAEQVVGRIHVSKNSPDRRN